MGSYQRLPSQVRGVHIANVVAPAIFGERGLLEPGSFSAATVRSCTVAECMILPPTSAAVPIIRARLPGDIARLERMVLGWNLMGWVWSIEPWKPD